MTTESVAPDCQRLRDSASDYLDGHISDREREGFELHRSNCAACESFLNEIETTVDLLAELRETSANTQQEAGALRWYTEFYPEPEVPKGLDDWTETKQRWGELVRLSADCQQKAIEADPRYQDPHLCDWLIVRARRISGNNPDRAAPIAELALAIARWRDWKHGDSKRLVQALENLAWCFVQLRDSPRAAMAFRELEDLRRERPMSREDEALYLSSKGIYYSHVGRFEEGETFLSQALAIRRQMGHRRQILCELVNLASIVLSVGSIERALEMYLEAKALIVPDEDPPRLQWAVYSDLALVLCEAQRVAEARALLGRVDELSGMLGGWYTRVYSTWLRGTLARSSGRLREAQLVFESVRGEFLRRGHLIWHIEASLDLARVYLAQSRFETLDLLATELVLRVGKSKEKGTNVGLAIGRFAEAVRQHSVTHQVLRAISVSLTPARLGRRLSE